MLKVEDYLTVKEAAAYIGVSPNTLRNWDRDRKISARRNPMNGYRLFHKADLDEVLAEIQRTSAHPTGWHRPATPR